MAVPFSFLDSTDFFYAQGKQIAPVSKRRPPLSEPFNRQPRLFLQKGAELLRGSARHPLFIAELAVVLSQNEHQVTVILRQPEELAIFPLSGRAGDFGFIVFLQKVHRAHLHPRQGIPPGKEGVDCVLPQQNGQHQDGHRPIERHSSPLEMCIRDSSNTVQIIEHYHNSSWLEHGGSPEKAVKSAFVNGIDAYLKAQGKYQKSESKITWADVEDCLVLVSNNFSTQTSYENQTKKAINNKFVQEAMTEFLRAQLEVYFIENPLDAGKIAEQVLINKRSRENAERTRLNIKKKLSGSVDIANRVQKFVDCRTKDTTRRELYIVEGDSALGLSLIHI